MEKEKYKILMISDHLLSTSGVGTQSRYLAYGLVATGKYKVLQLGAALKHQDHNIMQPHPDIIIKPIENFGTPEMLRQILVVDKPDVMLLFTDPRFFMQVFNMEDEIHQICPIAYNNLWDNTPDPEFNKPLYDSCDLLTCINEVSYSFVNKWFPEKTNYIPHALPNDLFYELEPQEKKEWRTKILNGKCDDHFVGIWVNRNARRKQPGDILVSWKLFLDSLEQKYGHRKATLILHTDPLDQEGPNLYKVAEMLEIRDNIFFSTQRLDFAQMNVLHNVSDFALTKSSAEGFGLFTLESLQVGNPIVVMKTGGLTRQAVDPETGFVYGVAVDPEVKSLAGSQLVPFIWDDFVSNETFAKAIMQLYEYGPEKRREIGQKAKKYVEKNYSLTNLVETWDKNISNLIETWRSDRSKVYRPYEVLSV